MEMTSRTLIQTIARLLKVVIGLLLVLTVFPVGVAAQQTATSQGSGTPQPPGAPQSDSPLVVEEGQTIGTLSGAQTQVFSTILKPDPNDPEHATDPTGRNFHWDSTMDKWVNSETGRVTAFMGYLCSMPEPSATSTPSAAGAPSGATPKENKSVSTSGFTPSIQLRGFGGATIVNGNTPATAGFDGAVLFPLGNRVLVGPTAGFQWVNSSIVSSIGSMTAGSTFANESVGFNQGNFGGTIGFPFGGWQLGIQGGATVASSTITQQTGFCGLGNATSPAGCTVSSTTNTHDTVVGPFVGGYISHSIFSHVGVFVEYDYQLLRDTQPNPTNPSGPSVTVFDLHLNTICFGVMFRLFGAPGK